MTDDKSSHNITGEDVQAWVDGELTELEAARVKAAVEKDSDLKRIAESIRKQNDLMQKLARYDSQNIHAEPENTPTTKALPEKSNPQSLIRTPFAYAAMVLLGMGIGWFGHDWTQRKTIEASWDNQALRVYELLTNESYWSTDFTPSDQDALNSATERLFGEPIPVPDLQEREFQYFGAKVLPDWDGSSLYLIYRDSKERLVTVTISSGHRERNRFRPRIVTFERLRFQTRMIGDYGISIAAPKDDEAFDFVSNRVFSTFR